MSKRLMELIVGLVFVAGVAVLGTYTIAISGITLGATKKYLVDFEQVYGLKAGDAVRVEGRETGKVASLELTAEGKVRAVLVVTRDVEIFREGSRVHVTPFSPLGGRVVEIKRGTPGSPRAAYTYFDGDTASSVSADQADVIQGTAEGELLATLNSLVEDNRENVTQIIANLEQVSERLTRTDSVLGYLINDTQGGADMDAVVSNLSSSSQRLDVILGRVENGEGVVGGLLEDGHPLEQNVEGAAESARESLDSLSTILARADAGESALGVLVADDPATTADVRGIVDDVKDITGTVAAGEGTVGKLVHDDRLYEGFADTGENLAEISTRVNEGEGLLGALLDDEVGQDTRRTIGNLGDISDAVNDPDAGTIGLLIHDQVTRDRVARVAEEVERLIVEFRDSLEDVREQAPVNAFIGAVFSAF